MPSHGLREAGGAARRMRRVSLAGVLLLRPAAAAFSCVRSGATCTALGDLYAATNGAGWELPNAAGVGVPPQAWAAAAAGTATDFCTFEGAVCDSANNLVSLALRGSALQGALPSSLGQVTTLTSLDLGANFLSGVVPASFAGLTALTALLLDDNLLSGALPAGLTQLPQLTTLVVDNNRLNGAAVAGAQCSAAAVCGSAAAFTAATCPLSGCGSSCAPACRPSCAVPAGSPGPAVAAVVAACNDTLPAASCNECTLALVTSVVNSGVPLPSNAVFARCLTDPMPQFLAASASPAVLSAALHNCAFSRRLMSNATCPPAVQPTVADFRKAVTPCVVPASACNTCSASLIDVFIRAGLNVAPLGLLFTTDHFNLVSNCLARHTLTILAANVSTETLLRGFAYCTGPSPGWYAAVQNATRNAALALKASASDGTPGSNVIAGAVVGATCGAAVVGACALVMLRRRRAGLPMTRGRQKDASASASIASASSGGGTSTSAMGTMKPMLLGEELVVGDLIGSGGYARVHRAAWNGTQVAVKCFEPLPWLNPMNLNRWESGPSFGLKTNESHTDSRSLLGGSSTGDSSDKMGGLMQELQLLQSLRHPNICAVYGLVLRPPMLVIELATAGSLTALLKRSTSASLPWATRVSIATGVAAGVEFLHAQEPPLIHRDLKSANVVLTDTLMPKLCDFGLSRVLPVLASSVTQAGTPQYMAPEVARGLPISRPTAIDTFGLGVVMHDLAHLGIVAAQAPAGPPGAPSGSTGGGAPLAHVLYTRASADFVVRLGPHVPPPLAKLVGSCLAVDPTSRPESGAVRAQLLLLLPASHGWTWASAE